MTAETGGRIDPTVYPVTTQVISAMRHAAGIASLIFERGFQFDVGGMTVIAVAGLVTESTDPLALVGCLTMVIRPVRSVDKSFIGDIFSLWIMAVCAVPGLLFQIGSGRMAGRQLVAALHGGASSQNPKSNKYNRKRQKHSARPPCHTCWRAGAISSCRTHRPGLHGQLLHFQARPDRPHQKHGAGIRAQRPAR